MENNKHNLHTALLLILVVMAGIIIWMLCNLSRSTVDKPLIDNTPKAGEVVTPTPKPTTKPVVIPAPITVNINQQFTITLNQTVTITGAGATITLTGFYNHPCPPNANCIWSGQDVFYTIKDTNTGVVYVKDGPLEQVPNMPFNVIVKSSDYTTSADLVVTRADGSIQ